MAAVGCGGVGQVRSGVTVSEPRGSGEGGGQELTVLHLTRAGDPVGGDREQPVKPCRGRSSSSLSVCNIPGN